MMDRVIWIRDKIASLRFVDLFWIFIGMTILPCLLFICGIVANNTFRTPPEPLDIKVIALSLCRGWERDGVPIDLSTPIPLEIEQILVCGHLQTNRSAVTIAVNWYYEGNYLEQDMIFDAKNQFSSDLTPSEKKFREGNYEVEVFAGREMIGNLKFRVERTIEK